MKATDNIPIRRWESPPARARIAAALGYALLAAVVIACLRSIALATNWDFAADALTQASDLAGRMTPPDFSRPMTLAGPILDTIHIATLGTLLATLLAVPLAFLTAANTRPHALCRPIALTLIVASRSINSLIWAMLFVAILGPGVLAGILAIAMRSIGFTGKLVCEAIEEIDPVQVEAIRATGASPLQTLAFGVIPQVSPAIAGIGMLRWDINIRESAVIGLVGAGGIGLLLDAAVSMLDWQRVSAILLIILGTVVLSECVSANVRRRLI